MGIPENHPAIVEARAKGLVTDTGPAKPQRSAARRKAPDGRVPAGGPRRPRWCLTLTLACRVVSEANRRDHWTVMRRRKEVQAQSLGKALAALHAALTPALLPAPLCVTWVHVGREMDDDNLRRAFKGLRDALAAELGVDDADPRVEWRYEQRAGAPGVELRIEGGAS